ncbi:MAG: hypothetical protein ACYDD2_03360 [Candidatus Acidiferrales bacterium]
MEKLSRYFCLLCVCGAFLWVASCGGGTHPNTQQTEKPAAPAYPPEVDQAAQKLFGAETEVLAYGDLAGNGKQEALVVNRLKKTPKGMVPGNLVTRAGILEDEGKGSWKEIFLCDEHFKNSKGFLGGQPLSPVNGWRLQYEQDAKKGLEMYFTPLQKPAGGYIQTFGVRWNPAVKRYQMLDRNFDKFLGELSTLEPIDDTNQ